jgi:hypothetical protein
MHADGEDVYTGLIPDYTGDSVTAETFLAVLAGDAEAVRIHGQAGRALSS